MIGARDAERAVMESVVGFIVAVCEGFFRDVVESWTFSERTFRRRAADLIRVIDEGGGGTANGRRRNH